MRRQAVKPETDTPTTNAVASPCFRHRIIGSEACGTSDAALSRDRAWPAERVPRRELLWPRLRRVTGFIQDNLNQQLTLPDLSAVVQMSPYHFARLFKQSTGVPPHRFVVEQRIARASALLREPQLSIGEVGRLVGFRTPSHFTAAFRRMTGITPSAYRGGWRHER
jgi:AraC family transcriptional regulator